MGNQKTYDFKVKFEKPEHVLDTDTYIQALVSLTTVLREVNYQIGGKEKISIEVTAEKAGSFDVELLLKAAESIFSHDSVTYLSGLVSILGGFITLKKIFGKADPEKTEINGDDVVIKDNRGTVLYQTNKNTYHIYTNNQVVHDAISDNFESLNNDEGITGFELKYGQNTVRAERSEFPNLAKKYKVQIEDKKEVDVAAHLIIVKLVLQDKRRKWEFLYDGVKINAKIIDQNFWKEIDSGKPFSKGDILVADLRILREYNSEVDAYINKDYQVLNVREHQHRQQRKQMRIDGMLE